MLLLPPMDRLPRLPRNLRWTSSLSLPPPPVTRLPKLVLTT